MNESIVSQVENQVAYLTLNRPAAFNSFNREMALRLQAALDQLGNDPDIRIIVIRGSGKAFSAGQDLNEVTDTMNSPGFKKILEEHYNPIVERIRSVSKPIIAAVNGVAAGAGANIALACDIVLASEKASFIQAFSKIGLVPDSGGSFFLPRLVGFHRATALMMTGDRVMADEAHNLGMVYKVYREDSFQEEVKSFSERMAAMPPIGLSRTKQLLNETYNHTLKEQLEAESRHQIAASETEDYAEGVQAFLEKRKPVFRGK